jgi:hypothetical protein
MTAPAPVGDLNRAVRDSYLKVAETLGGSYGAGDQWVIHGDDVAAVMKAVATPGHSDAASGSPRPIVTTVATYRLPIRGHPGRLSKTF